MQVQIKTTPQLNALMRNIDQLSKNLTQGFDWESLAPIVAEAADNIFASEGRGGWPQLSEAYARWKARNFPGKGILDLTGAYRKAATQIGAPGNVITTTENSLTYGVEGLDYPAYHETGTNQLPARPVFDLLVEDEELSRAVTEAFSEHINQKLSEALIAR